MIKNIINEKLEICFIIFSIIYGLFAFFYFLNLPAYGGDEFHFHNEINSILKNGWIYSIKEQISIPYMILVYPFSFIFKDYIALRLVNVLLTILLYIYFYVRISNKIIFFCYFTFFLSTVYYFFIGTNDTLFNLSFLIFLCECFRKLNGKTWNGSLALSALIVAFFTRELIFVYLPLIVFLFYFLYKERVLNGKIIKVPLIVFLFFILLNIPSFLENAKISYDYKKPPLSAASNWNQRQYLTQLKINEGFLANNNHVTWVETDNYLLINGPNSLPRSIVENIVFDFKLTVKEFFKDVLISFYYSFRQLGGILFFILFLIFNFFKEKCNPVKDYFFPLSFLMMVMILSFIIISNVELRWLAPVLIMNIVVYWSFQEVNKISLKFINLNYLILCFFCCYGIFKFLM